MVILIVSLNINLKLNLLELIFCSFSNIKTVAEIKVIFSCNRDVIEAKVHEIISAKDYGKISTFIAIFGLCDFNCKHHYIFELSLNHIKNIICPLIFIALRSKIILVNILFKKYSSFCDLKIVFDSN